MYWDPLATIGMSAEWPLVIYPQSRLGPSADYLRGAWADKDWRNVPGPFYGAGTDNCGTGRLNAPGHVIYEDCFAEVVYRQPRTPHEVHLLLSAAYSDPFCHYACDGDDHWTLSLVRDWWADRDRLLAWIHTMGEEWSVSASADDREAAAGLRDYAAYVSGALETHLREYGFWLEYRRPATPGEALPDLGPALTEQ
ncbi:ferredoxin [Nocardia sp. NPDC052566]|uniref:ferredoxin n=1 Tax=Nocardia sp. NPDC052566 TaxID=3364330 RepID=UPI0037C9911B